MEANDKFDAIRCATELTLFLNETGILDGCYGAAGFKDFPLIPVRRGKEKSLRNGCFIYILFHSLFSLEYLRMKSVLFH